MLFRLQRFVRHGDLKSASVDKVAAAAPLVRQEQQQPVPGIPAKHEIDPPSVATDASKIHGAAQDRQAGGVSLVALSASGEAKQLNPEDGYAYPLRVATDTLPAAQGPDDASLSVQSGHAEESEEGRVAEGQQSNEAEGGETKEPCHPCTSLIRGGGGVAGPPGPPGPRGITGAPGSTGVAGERGETGYYGPPGPRGLNGTNGTNGTRGPTQLDGVPASAAKIQYVFFVVGAHVFISFMAYQVLKINEQKYKQEAHNDELEAKAAAFDFQQGGGGGGRGW